MYDLQKEIFYAVIKSYIDFNVLRIKRGNFEISKTCKCFICLEANDFTQNEYLTKANVI